MKYEKEKELYKHTLLLNKKQKELVPKNSTTRCVKSTIINRAYYSTYLYVKKYLINKGYTIKDVHYYRRKKERFKTEHQQVIDNLSEENKELSVKLMKLKRLRNKADYHPEVKITKKEVNISLNFMNNILNELID